MEVDAVVNAANTELKMGGGVCGAIFKAAGPKELQEACDKMAPIRTGEAVISPGFRLAAKYIIHTAGPIYNGSRAEESEKLLRLSYENSLKLAVDQGLESLAFPLISSGIYGYPKEEAFRIASQTIQAFLEKEDLNIYLILFDKESYKLSRELIGDIEAYIDENYVETHQNPRSSLETGLASYLRLPAKLKQKLYEEEASTAFSAEAMSAEAEEAKLGSAEDLSSLIADLDEPFSTLLFKLIDLKGMSDVEVYKRANIDRKLFSKIRSNKAYNPSKRTVMALAIALRLSLDESRELLRRAGYAFSHAVKFDVIVEYFITHEIYDIFQINEVLFEYDQMLLGA